MRQLFNHHQVYEGSKHIFSILTEYGLNWKQEKHAPTMHLVDSNVCVEISRNDAVRALREVKKQGLTIKSSFK